MQVTTIGELVEDEWYRVEYWNKTKLIKRGTVKCINIRYDGADIMDGSVTISIVRGDNGTFHGVGCPDIGMCTVKLFQEELPFKGGNAFVDSIKPPTAQLASLPPGATSAAQAAFLTQQSNAQALNSLNKVVSGGWRPSIKSRSRPKSRKRVRWAGTVPIYTPTVSYPEAGTGDNTIAAINKQLTSTIMQSQANAQFDKNAVIKGGTKKRRRRRSKRCSHRCSKRCRHRHRQRT
jgi:hypothetical protein